MTKFALTLASQLQDMLERLQPVLEALRAGDQTALFMDIAPGLADEIHGRIRETVLRLVRAGWVAGRRGRVARILMDAQWQLQRGRSVETGNKACIHLGEALGHLRQAAMALSRLYAHRRSSDGG